MSCAWASRSARSRRAASRWPTAAGSAPTWWSRRWRPPGGGVAGRLPAWNWTTASVDAQLAYLCASSPPVDPRLFWLAPLCAAGGSSTGTSRCTSPRWRASAASAAASGTTGAVLRAQQSGRMAQYVGGHGDAHQTAAAVATGWARAGRTRWAGRRAGSSWLCGCRHAAVLAVDPVRGEVTWRGWGGCHRGIATVPLRSSAAAWTRRKMQNESGRRQWRDRSIVLRCLPCNGRERIGR